MSAPQSSPSPARSQGTQSLTYSMDSDPAPSSSAQPSSPRRASGSALPPAYEFQRTDHVEGAAPPHRGSFGGETTEDSIDQSMDRSVDFTEFSTTSGGYEGLNAQQQQRQGEMGADNDDNLEGYYTAHDAQGFPSQPHLSPVSEHPAASGAGNGDDATATIHRMHKKLLQLLSSPELFHDALEWQAMLDRGLDPSLPAGTKMNDVSALTKTFETEFEEDSTFKGLQDDDEEKAKVEHTEDETFEFNPNETKEDTTKEVEAKGEEEPTPKEAPLPHQIFAPDAEVVLPQALTASQLFGMERTSGIELEAAAGMTGVCQLFLRWLALLPEGDHDNIVDPPGLTVMKIAGGGYRVTGAHRAVWRWMNKFSPGSAGQGGPTDFDFGDLVTMTIIDVFETDATGKLLSYCPTFDNRAVHKTPETIERLRKGATQVRETMEYVAQSPVGKGAVRYAGKSWAVGVRSAMVVGHVVRNRIHHKAQEGAGEGGQLNELLESQIAEDETTEGGDSEVDSAALQEDPTASPARRQLV
ncbi:hypothetical protein ACHAXT_011777 [Thalassiosira profunda]